MNSAQIANVGRRQQQLDLPQSSDCDLSRMLADLFAQDLLNLQKGWQEPSIEQMYEVLDAFCKKHRLKFQYHQSCLRNPFIFATKEHVCLLNNVYEAQVEWRCFCFAYNCHLSKIVAKEGAVLAAFHNTRGRISDGAIGIGYPGSHLIIFDGKAIILEGAWADAFSGAKVLAMPGAQVLALDGSKVWATSGSKVTAASGTVYAARYASIGLSDPDEVVRIVREGDPNWSNPDSMALSDNCFKFWNQQRN